MLLFVKKKLQEVSYFLLKLESATYLGYTPRCISGVICIQAHFMFMNILRIATKRRGKKEQRQIDAVSGVINVEYFDCYALFLNCHEYYTIISKRLNCT